MQGSLTVFRQATQRELLRDLQDYLYDRFQRPSLILIPQGDGSFYSCFPRKRTPIPDELFHHVLQLLNGGRFPVEQEESAHARLYHAVETASDAQEYDWHTLSVGLTDFYCPIRLPSHSTQIEQIAIIVFGKYLCQGDTLSPALHAWIDTVVAHYRMGSGASLSADKLTAIHQKLHELADRIPIITHQQRHAIEKDLLSAIALAQILLQRLLNVESLFRGSNELGDLGLGQPDLHINAPKLWTTVEGALERLCRALSLTSAAVYAARYRDTADMKLVASIPRSIAKPSELALASSAEFAWLQTQNWVNVPNDGARFGWFIPKTILATSRGLLFGREMVGGNLVILCVGFSSDDLPPPARAVLYDAVNAQVFRFIDNALFGIEMDNLMAETGHLMGRAMGKVSLGVETLRRILPKAQEKGSRLDQRYQNALWAIDDGETHLELIRQNFYAFQTRRRQGDPDHAAVGHLESTYSVFEVASVIDTMRTFFDRAAQEGNFKPIKYVLTTGSTAVKGDRDAIRLALLNLFDNALKFSYANTFFTLAVTSRSPECVISMINLGVGVPSNEAKNVFKAFTKSSFRDPIKKTEGLGLGLPYCRWVVEEIFRGTIHLTSAPANMPSATRFEGDNWLTTVTISLPLWHPQPRGANEETRS